MERSRAFRSVMPIYERMVRLRAHLGELDGVLAAMERGRARSLLDQLAVQGIDLLSGVEAGEADELKTRITAARSRMAQIEQRLGQLDDSATSTEEGKRARHALIADLQRARRYFVTTRSDIRNASPAYRLAVSKNQRPVTLSALQAYVDQRDALLLRFFCGDLASYVLVIQAERPPRLEPLTLDDSVAAALDVEPGPFLANKMSRALARKNQAGVMQLLRASHQRESLKQLTPKLEALWRALIPATERQRIVEGAYKQLILIPDGALATLPFEALVVEDGESPVYLLDQAPPTCYAPSATVLHNLASRQEAGGDQGRKPVLTVGDPDYGKPADRAAADDLGPGSRYVRLRGQLQDLPHSGLESRWVSQVFDKRGLEAGRLIEAKATERNVAFNLPGRRIVHLACHGLTELSDGNLFGALALTPGRGSNANDDGFLSLAEIYELDMRGCELTVLSACDTNYGPRQKGEGVWALSRGFLVAGSRESGRQQLGGRRPGCRQPGQLLLQRRRQSVRAGRAPQLCGFPASGQEMGPRAGAMVQPLLLGHFRACGTQLRTKPRGK